MVVCGFLSPAWEAFKHRSGRQQVGKVEEKNGNNENPLGVSEKTQLP